MSPEVILQQMMLRDIYTKDVTSPEFQWALTEIADECRHSVMFGRLIEALGCPAYPTGAREHMLGRYLVSTARANPHFRATLRWAGAKAATFLAEHGLIAGPGRPLWRRSGLI